MYVDRIRSFKNINLIKIGNDKYKYEDSIYLSNTNRYQVKNDQTPHDAAKKIYKNIIKENKNKQQLMFAMMETTRNNGHRLYFYKGSIEKRKNEKYVIFNKGLKNPKKICIKYNYIVEPMTANILGHSNPLANWK